MSIQKIKKLAPLTNIIIIFLILYSVIIFSLETLPGLSPEIKQFFRISEIVIIIVFTIEYICRILFAKKKLKFIFSFHGIIDIISILPFYLPISLDLKSLRIIRFFRIFRVLKLVRYNQAIDRFIKAMVSAKEEIIIFLAAITILLFFSSVGIYFFENSAQPEKFKSIPHSLWWAVITLTTVGYGDVYPITTGGRIFTFFILVFGLGTIAIPAGIIASALSQIKKKNSKEE